MTTSNSMQERPGSGSAGLLVSILLRFPEVGSVTYDPAHHALRFTMLFRGKLTAQGFAELRHLVTESVLALSMLQGAEARTIDVERTTFKGVTALGVLRDVESLTREEIAMLIALIRDRFGDGMVVEAEGGLIEEDLLVQEQLIDAALDDLRDARQHQNLIAYREGGRVMVFNK